ncbi:MAG: hypothetical protein ACK5P6_12285 [Pseudobdellovibrionaceae bacterium]
MIERKIYQNTWFPYLFILLLCAAYSYRLLDYENVYASALAADSTSHIGNNYDYCTTGFMWGETTTDKFYFPTGVDLALNYDQPFLNLITCPVGWLAGPIAMFNFYSFLQLFLVMAFSWLYISKHAQNLFIRVSFLFFFGMCGYVQNKLLGQPNLMSTVWALPLTFYLFEDNTFTSLKKTLIAFLAIGVALTSAWQNGPNLFLIVGFFVLRELFKKEQRLLKFKNIAAGTVLMMFFVLPFVLPMFIARARNEYMTDLQGIFLYYGDLLSLWVPPFWHWMYPLFSKVVGTYEPYEPSWPERAMGLDVLLTVLFIYLLIQGLRLKQAWKRIDYLVLGLSYFILSFGPLLAFGNYEILYLKYFPWLNQFLPFSMTRTPARYLIIVIFVIVAWSLVQLDRQKSKLPQQTFLFVSVLVAIWSVFQSNLPRQNFRFPVFYYREEFPYDGIQAMQEAPRDSLIFSLPVTMLPHQFVNFAQMKSDLKLITGYVSYTLLTQDRLQSVIRNWGGLANLTCQPDPVSEGEIKISTGDPEPILEEMYQRKIRFITVQPATTNCEIIESLVAAFSRSPRVKTYARGIYKILEIKKAR